MLLAAFPLKLAGIEASPVRAVALVGDSESERLDPGERFAGDRIVSEKLSPEA